MRGALRAAGSRLLRVASRIGVRLLLFNVLLVFLPVAGLASLDAYEVHLLDQQERGMVQDGRLLSAMLSGLPTLDAALVQRAFDRLAPAAEARLRIVLADGRVIGDSHRLQPEDSAARSPLTSSMPAAISTRASRVYRLGAWLGRTWRTLRKAQPRVDSRGIEVAPGTVRGAVLDRALAGGYGSATFRSHAGQRSMTLYSALPIRDDGGQVVAVALVSQTTFRLLQRLYDIRLRMFEVVVGSLVAAAVLSLLTSTTIVTPLRRLRDDAAAIAGRRVRLSQRFRGTGRFDEIGELARALDELTVRLNAHVQFTERFAADVSHEFRNPLASIRASAEMLAEADAPEARRSFSARIEQDITRLEGLLARVREITEIDARLEDEPLETIDVASLCGELIDGRNGRGVKSPIEGHLTPSPVYVRASRDRLVQVLENLLDNAESFSPPGGRIALTVVTESGRARVSVSDNGPGIAPEHVERVFDRFFSHRPEQPGARQRHAGLGLSIAKAIVETYAGEIRAGNQPAGGARFDVYLPVTDDERGRRL